MRKHLSRSVAPLLTPLLLLLFAQGVSAQAPSVTTAQPAAESALIVKRTLPANSEIRKLDLPADQLTITVLRGDATTGFVSDPNSAGGSLDRVELAKVRLDTETVRVSSFDDLLRRLKDNNIAATPDVLGLILDLNPTISRLDSLAPQTKLLLPEVEGDSALRRLAAGQPATLVSDLASIQREALNRERAELRTLSERLTGEAPARLGSEQDRAAVEGALAAADNGLQVIGSRAFAVSHRVREQTAIEAEMLESIVSEAMNSGGGLSPEKVLTVRAIGEAMAVRSQNIRSGGSGSASVEVQTLKRSDGSEVKHKRVFYAPKLKQSAANDYRAPSSPTTEALPIGGEYTFWASEGDPAKPISNKVTITVRTNNDPVKLQLPPPEDD